MEGPRAPDQHEADSVIAFLDRHLRAQHQWSIQDEYPTTFARKNFSNLRIIKDEKEVLSHAAVRMEIVRSLQAVFQVAAIGSVVTSDQHRQKGLSSTILQECLDMARTKGADFAILWTNLFDFYRRLGFELAGTEVAVQIDRPAVGDKTVNIIESSQISAESILRIFQSHTVASVRTAEEIQQYLKIPNSRVYTAWTPDGRLCAYAVEGKGADLNGYIHEWGGGVLQLITLLSHIQQTQGRTITLIAPKNARNLLRQCEQIGWPMHHGNLGMIKILNPQQLFTKVRKHAQNRGVAGFVLDTTDQGYTVGIGAKTFGITDESTLIRLLFGPLPENFVAALPEDIKPVICSLFPLDFWIWGWDSI